MFNILKLRDWNFFFLIGAIFAACSLRMLKYVKEEGEVKKNIVVEQMIETLKAKRRENFSLQAVRTMYRGHISGLNGKKKICQNYLRQVFVYLNIKNVSEKPG